MPIDVGDWFRQIGLGEEDAGHCRVHVWVALRQRLETAIHAAALAMLWLFRGCRVVMVEDVRRLIANVLYRSLHDISLLEALDERVWVDNRAARRDGCLVDLGRALLIDLQITRRRWIQQLLLELHHHV